jgi:inner membrane protein
MDSITHTALGATLAYSLLGKQLGRKALLYGAITGNIPDLDILAYPWLGALERLEWHRGISHSLFFHAISSIPLALFLKNIHHRFALSSIPVPRTILTLFLVLSTHALLDACTVYGTQLLSPFTDTRYAWNIIFIIDPFFTLPLLFASIIIALPFLKKLHRPSLARYTILLCVLYLFSLILIKQHIDNRFAQARKNQGISIITPSLSAPGFPGPFLWREISRSPEGCYIAYASLLDSQKHRITHSLLSFPLALQQRWQHHPTLRRLQWFSENHGYLSEDAQGHLIYHDTRFGETRLDPHSALTPDNTFTLFRWKLIPNPDGKINILPDRRAVSRSTMLPVLWQRLLGHPVL